MAIALVAACTGASLSEPGSRSQVPSAASNPISSVIASASPEASFGFAASTPWHAALKFQVNAPEGLLYEDGSLWVVEHHSGTMFRVDPGTGTIQAKIPGMGFQAQLPFSGGGLIWTSSPTSLVAIDPRTNGVVRHFSGTFSLDGVFVDGRLWIDNGSDDLLSLDPITGTEVTRVRSATEMTEGCLNSVTYGAGSIWWSVNDASTLVRVDPATGTIAAQIKNMDQPSVAILGNDVWVVGYDGIARLLDPNSNEVSASVRYRVAEGGCPASVAVDGSKLWIVDAVTYSSFYQFDGRARADTGHFDPGDSDIQDLIVANGSLWMDFFESGFVARFDQPSP